MAADIVLTTQLNLDGATRDINRLPSLIKPIPLKFEGGLALGKITGQVSEFQKSLAASNARVLAFSASAGQLYTYVRVFDNILKSTIEVQKSLTNLNVIFGLSRRQLDSFTTSLFKVASETGQSFKVASDAALEFSRQGLGVEETLRRTKDALTLTRLSGLEVAESIRTLTTVINGFNQAGLDSTTIINKLTSVDTAFSISAADIAQALTRVGSIAKDTGVSFDKLLGLITSARVTTGREGSVIATSLGTIFQRIERPQVLQQLKELKVVTEDANGENLSADKILQNLAKTYGGLEQSQKSQIIQFAGGVRQGNVLRALLADLARENSVYQRATEASANATDVAKKRQEALNKTLSSQINETVNNFTQAAYRIGTITLTPAIGNILGIGNSFSKIINSALDTQGQESGKFLGAGILTGIGNYLSGPGLALGAAVITRFFTNFISFASKSLTQLLEIGSDRYAKEQAIEQILAREPGLLLELNRLGGDNVLIQERITQELEKQLTLQNAKATVLNSIYTGIKSELGIASQEKPFRINGKGELSRNQAVGFIPSIKETLGALQAGYNPGQIRDLNIGGVGKVTYNTAETIKKFPGFNQPAILPPETSKAGYNYKKKFQSFHGFNPYAAEGIIPNQDIPYPFNLLPSNLVPEKYKQKPAIFNPESLAPDSVRYGRPPELQPFPKLLTAGNGRSSINLPELSQSTIEEKITSLKQKQINEEISNYKTLLENGVITQKQLNSATTQLAEKYNLTAEATSKIYNNFNSSLSSRPQFINDPSRLLEAPGSSTARVEQRIQELVGRFDQITQKPQPRSVFLDENYEKKRVLYTPPSDDFTKSQRRSTFEEERRANRISSRLVNPDALAPLSFSPEKQAITAKRQAEISKRVEALRQERQSQTLTDIKPGEYGPSDSEFRYRQTKERFAYEDKQNRGLLSRGDYFGPDASTLFQSKQQEFTSNLNKNFGLLSLLNPVKYDRTEKEATNLQQLGSFRNRTSELQNRAFLASFITPIIGGVIEQAIPKDTTTGRGFSRLAGGATNVASFALTGAGIGGPYGALGGAALGLATELPSIIKAFTDTLPDLQRNLDNIKESTQKTTRGLESFAKISSQLSDIYNGSSPATKGQEKSLLQQRSVALSQLSGDTRAQLNEATKAGDEGKIGEIINNASVLARQQQSSREDLIGLKQLIEKNNPNFLEGAKKDTLQGGKSYFDTVTGNEGFLSKIIGAVNLANPLSIPLFSGTAVKTLASNRDVERAQSNFDLSKETRPFLQSILGFQNQEGKSLLEQLKPQDIERIQNSQGDNKLNTLSTVLGQHGILGNDLPRFIEDLKNTFTKSDSKDVLNKDINRVFSQKTISDLNENSQDVQTGVNKVAKSFSDFSRKLVDFQNGLDKFTRNIESSAIIRLSLTSGNLRSSEIIQKTSNQSSLSKSGGNPFLGNQFQFEEERKKIQDELTIGLQKNSGETKLKIGDILNGIGTNESNGIRERVLANKESGNISPQQEKKAEEQLQVLSKLFNGPQYIKIKELLQKPENLTEQDLNKIDKFVGNQLNILDRLRQSTDIADVQTGSSPFEKSINQLNKNEIFGVGGENVIKSRPVNRQSSAQIETLSKGLGISPSDIDKIFDDRVNLYNTIEKGFESFRKVVDGSKKENLTLRGGIFEQNKINSTQFEQNKRLISPAIALSSDQQRILAQANDANSRIGNGSSAASGYKTPDGQDVNLLKTFASGFQYNSNQFFADLTKNTQEFGKQFKDAFAGAFSEAENSSKKFTDILRDRFLSLAQNLTSKFIGQGLDSLFGNTIGKLAPVFGDVLQSKSSGGLIARYSDGGFVGMGSGTKDDVPAMLTGGEYVLTKNAVQSIGIDNLDKLNNSEESEQYNSIAQDSIKLGSKAYSGGNDNSYKNSSISQAKQYISFIKPFLKADSFATGDLVPYKQPNEFSYNYGKNNPRTYAAATTADSITSTGTSASINLANAYSLDKPSDSTYQKGQLNVSPLLSTYGATDLNNGQNKLKFSREKFVTDTDIKNRKIAVERSQFNTNQDITLSAAYVSAGTQVYGGVQNIQQSNAATDFNYKSANDFFGSGEGSSSSSLNSLSGFGNAKGGTIRKMALGGIFGGDSHSDRTPAMLMGGEYVMKPSAVSKYGANYFNNLNRKYAAGGYVGGSSTSNGSDYSKLLSDQFQKSLDILQEISGKLSNNSNPATSTNPNNKSNVSNPNQNNASSGGGVTNNVTVNITMSSTSTGATTNGDSKASSSSSNQGDKDTAKKLGDLVNSQMMTLLINQSKTGGILFERFQTRTR